MHKVCREVVRVAELVLAFGVWQGSLQIVVLSKMERDVLEGGACSLGNLCRESKLLYCEHPMERYHVARVHKCWALSLSACLKSRMLPATT